MVIPRTFYAEGKPTSIVIVAPMERVQLWHLPSVRDAVIAFRPQRQSVLRVAFRHIVNDPQRSQRHRPASLINLSLRSRASQAARALFSYS